MFVVHLTPKQTAKKLIQLERNGENVNILVKRSLSVFFGRTTPFSIGTKYTVDEKTALHIVKLGADEAIRNEPKVYLKGFKKELKAAGINLNGFSNGKLKELNRAERILSYAQ